MQPMLVTHVLMGPMCFTHGANVSDPWGQCEVECWLNMVTLPSIIELAAAYCPPESIQGDP